MVRQLINVKWSTLNSKARTAVGALELWVVSVPEAAQSFARFVASNRQPPSISWPPGLNGRQLRPTSGSNESSLPLLSTDGLGDVFVGRRCHRNGVEVASKERRVCDACIQQLIANGGDVDLK